MSSSPQHVLIIDGESIFATAVARCLAAAGDRVHLLSRNAGVSARVSRAVASFTTWSDAEGTRLSAATDLAARVGASVGFAVDQVAIRECAAERRPEHLPLTAVPPLESFDIAADKWSFASVLRTFGFDHPPTILWDGSAEAHVALQSMSYPVLLKPRQGSNGLGIVRFETRVALRQFLDAHPDASGRMIVQTEIAGSDIDCSVFCRNGRILAHTIQRPVVPAGREFAPAGGIEFEHDTTIYAVVERLMRQLSWNGIAHLDLRYEALTGRPFLIEMNPRYWGSLLGSLRAGVNFPSVAVGDALGLRLSATGFSPCRYVGGKMALRTWLAGLSGRHAALPLQDTAWAHLVRDPAPSVIEAWAKIQHRAPAVRPGAERPARADHSPTVDVMTPTLATSGVDGRRGV